METEFSLGGSVVTDASGSHVPADCSCGSVEAVSELTIDLLVCKEARIRGLLPASDNFWVPCTPLPGYEVRDCSLACCCMGTSGPGAEQGALCCVSGTERQVWTLVPGSVDCAGILKLRNSDIELRKGETDIGRKNTRVRLVFRVHIPQPNGRTLSLQVASNPIECCEYQSRPRVTRSVFWHLFCPCGSWQLVDYTHVCVTLVPCLSRRPRRSLPRWVWVHGLCVRPAHLLPAPVGKRGQFVLKPQDACARYV